MCVYVCIYIYITFRYNFHNEYAEVLFSLMPERSGLQFMAEATDVFSAPKSPDQFQNLPSLLFNKYRFPFT